MLIAAGSVCHENISTELLAPEAMTTDDSLGWPFGPEPSKAYGYAEFSELSSIKVMQANNCDPRCLASTYVRDSLPSRDLSACLNANVLCSL